MEPERDADLDAPRGVDEENAKSPLAVGTVTLTLLLVYYWLSGAIFPDDEIGLPMSPAQITGMALTYSTTPAFLLAALLWARRRTRRCIDQLVDSGAITSETAQSRDLAGAVKTPAANVALTILGLALGATQVGWLTFMDSFGGPGLIVASSLAVGNFVTWLLVVHVVVRRILASRSVQRLGRDHTKVDLMRLDALLPFGRIGTFHVLIVAIAVSFSAFQSLDAEFRVVNYSAAFAAGIPAGVALLLLPMIGIHQNVRATKQQALAQLDEAIVHADRGLEPLPLHYLVDLVQQRDAIARAREWPLDTTAFSRIAIYFVIPPLAWVGGALVEILLQTMIEPGP